MGKWCCLVVVLVGCGRMGFEARLGDNGSPEPDPVPPPPGSVRIDYAPAIAECIDPAVPSLSRCSEFNGADQLVVDGNDGKTNSPWEIVLRFDLDDQLAGRTIHSVTLVLTSTDDDKADGPDSGAIWELEPFTLDTLVRETPALVRVAPMALSKGAVDQDEEVAWVLPESTVTSGSSVSLGVITGDDSGGVNYWKLGGAAPPRLEVVAL